MGIDRDRVKKIFPHLADELERGEVKIGIRSVRSDAEAGEKITLSHFTGYVPDVTDFLHRCDTEEQAVEIIDFMEERKEISTEYAEKLRKQLKEKGVRSFGPKKEHDYYLKQAGY